MIIDGRKVQVEKWRRSTGKFTKEEIIIDLLGPSSFQVDWR